MSLELELFPSSALKTADELREGLRQLFRDLGRIVAPNGIDEARHVTIGGVPQWVAMRGQDRSQPVLLFLHGGPNSPVSDIAYSWQRTWEDFFVVVNWDQRGCGRSTCDSSQDASAPTEWTRERMVEDTAELIDWLRVEFNQQRIIVVGQSWGTVLALEMARRFADRLHLVVLQGLAVEWLASAEMLRLALIDEARKSGNEAEAQRLTEVGPVPPPTDPDAVMAWVPRFGVPIPGRHTWHNIDGPGDGWARRVDLLRYVSPDLSAEQYALDKSQMLEGGERMYARHVAGMKAAMSWNADRDVGTEFDVPVVVMQGTHDWQTWTEIARGYFDRVRAPWKLWVEFPHAAHALNVEQPGLSIVSLVTASRAAISGGEPPGATVRGGQ